MRLPIGRGSHRDGGNEEVPGEEGAQTQNEEADPDQVVAVPRGVSVRHDVRSPIAPGPLQGGCTCAYAGLGSRRAATLAGVWESQGRRECCSQ